MREAILARHAAPSHSLRLFARWRELLSEPFFHFLVLGAVLFGINQYLEVRSRFTHIAITPVIVQGIAENYRLQYGSLPTPQRLDALVEARIREEVFYHEALRLGLDQDDEIIRRRLVQKYEFLQQDLEIVADPSEQTLRAFIEAEAYDGPSLIIAYSHCIAHGINMTTAMKNQKAAVDSGQWPLYRYNPDRALAGENPLSMDSRAPKLPLKEYLQMENRFKMLEMSKPDVAAQLFAEAQEDVHIRWAMYDYLASRSFKSAQGES